MTFLQERTIGLSLFRVLISCFLIKKIIFLLPMANDLFGVNGITPYGIYLQALSIYGLEVWGYPFQGFFSPTLFLVVMLCVSGAYLFGIGRGVTGIILLYMLTVLRLRNGFILDGSDNVIQVVLPFLIFADAYHYYTHEVKWPKFTFLNRALNYPPVRDVRSFVSQLALLGILIQVCFVYFFTAIAKLQGELWLNGTAIYYTMRVEEFRATDWNIPLTRNHYFVVLGTYFTIFIELAFIFLVWFRPVKFYVLGLCVMLHVGIWIFMRIDDFSWVMISTYLLFVSDREYSAVSEWIAGKRQVLSVLFSRLITTKS